MNNFAFDLLINDIFQFNEWRIKNATVKLDFSNCSFDDQNLSEGYLFGIAFYNCSFRNANLRESVFTNSIADHSDFYKAEMQYVVFGPLEIYRDDIPDDLRDYLYAGASLKNCSFKSTNLAYSNFRDTNIENADFSFANLEGAEFIDTNYRLADFSSADKSEAIFDRGR